jgi:hypothetical protein
MSTSLSSNNLLNLLAIKKQSNGTFRISLNGNALHNFIESTTFTTIPFYEDNLNLLKKKNILRLDLTHTAFDHLWQPLPLQNIPPLENDTNNSIVRRQG